MTEEKALDLFARCYNRCDFTDFFHGLGRKAVLEAYNRFYRHEGRASIARLLGEKGAELRSMPRPCRAYRGFLMSRHDLFDLPKCDNCVVLTGHDPNDVIGIVRIKCGLFKIRDIRILDPAQCNFTRGNYCGKE